MNAEIPIADLRWIISHIPEFPVDLANRMHAMGMGVLVGWGPLRTGTNVGPPYRMLMNHPIRKGYHSDGGDITVINPWLNFYTIVTGRNLAGPANPRRSDAHAPGNAVARHRGQQMVHLGGRPRLD